MTLDREQAEVRTHNVALERQAHYEHEEEGQQEHEHDDEEEHSWEGGGGGETSVMQRERDSSAQKSCYTMPTAGRNLSRIRNPKMPCTVPGH